MSRAKAGIRVTGQRADAAGLVPGMADEAELFVATAEQMQLLAGQVAQMLRPGDLIVLTGDLGAGKTTFVQGLGAALGVQGDITSPTFVIARVHPALGEGPDLVHVDAYRLGSLAEVDDLDLDASLEDSVTVVEWGEGMVEGLAPDRLVIAMRRPIGAYGPDEPPVTGDEPRTVRMRGYGPRWEGVQLPR